MRKLTCAAVAVALMIPGAVGAADKLPEGDLERGEQFYWEGLNRAGEPVPVVVQGDVESTSDNFACVGCHRPSGFGGSEGSQYVPPITKPILFNERQLNRERRNRHFKDLFKEEQSDEFFARVRMPRMRPAYDRQSLARAIRQGIDAAGRELAEGMPRYDVDDQTLADVVAYMKTLSVEKSPGVGEKKLHLATVVSEGVDAAKKKAVLETIRAFAEWYNRDIEGQMEHPNFSPYYRSEFKESFRLWEVHEWELTGPRSTWTEQLQDYYKQQKVFAVVSGVVDGPWSPVDAFCDGEHVPCVFPNTDLPDTERAEYGYSIYFSRGLELEGQALASYLATREQAPQRIVQIHAGQPAGEVPAKAFGSAAKNHLSNAEVTTESAGSEKALQEAIAAQAKEGAAADLVVIWPGDYVDAAVAALNESTPQADTIALPSTALATAKSKLSPELHGKVLLTHPYEKPKGYHPRKFRVRAWFHSRGVDVTHPRLQLQTYYALTQMQYSIGHLVSDFYRDYLIEFIEHEAEAELNPGTHPKLALGPGQRFASKGAYMIRLDPEAKEGYKPVSDWIVPSQ